MLALLLVRWNIRDADHGRSNLETQVRKRKVDKGMREKSFIVSLENAAILYAFRSEQSTAI